MKTSVFLTFGIITINILIAIIIVGFNDAFSTIKELPLTYISGIVSLYLFGYLFAEPMIRLIQKYEALTIFIGIVGLFIILICSLLFGSSVSIFEKMWFSDNFEFDFYRFYGITILLVLFFGGIPTAISGAFLGYLLKKDIK